MKPAGQLTLTLTEELEQFVRHEVKTGAFASNSEYIRELVRERYRKKMETEERKKELDAALARGLMEEEAGQTLSLSEAFAQIRKNLGI